MDNIDPNQPSDGQNVPSPVTPVQTPQEQPSPNSSDIPVQQPTDGPNVPPPVTPSQEPQIQQTPIDSSGTTAQQNPPLPDQVSGTPPAPTNENSQGDYINNVGESLIDLLTDISLSDPLKQKVADAMRLPVMQITATLDGLLDKIDNEQITSAELALIITAPVADETPEQEKPV